METLYEAGIYSPPREFYQSENVHKKEIVNEPSALNRVMINTTPARLAELEFSKLHHGLGVTTFSAVEVLQGPLQEKNEEMN